MHADAVEAAVLELDVYEQDGHLVATAAGFRAGGLSERLEGDRQRGAAGAGVGAAAAAALRPTRGNDVGFWSGLIFLLDKKG